MRKILLQAAFAAVVLAVCGGTVGCYDTTQPTPPCSANVPNPGCPDWLHDARRGAGGRPGSAPSNR